MSGRWFAVIVVALPSSPVLSHQRGHFVLIGVDAIYQRVLPARGRPAQDLEPPFPLSNHALGGHFELGGATKSLLVATRHSFLLRCRYG